MSKRAEMIGKKFGKLLAVEAAGHLGNHLAYKCLCDCGTEKIVQGNSLRSGNTTSCGCAFKEMVGNRFRTHGMKSSREHATWQMMMNRCNNTAGGDYHRYGGRGITVCDSWRSFENFYADMGKRPEGTSLDRIDNNGPYSPDNCRWATAAEQARNTRKTKLITFQGETKCLKDWASHLGLSYATLSNRINRNNWPVEKALTTPARPINVH